ncbi:helix-turn-helix domain-containing protein [Streptomyces sp. NPDC046860]|uniref:transcriptional regulator n=1 Tax=Streptomyces sp. NPDC046860 TaxID=3154495 RepID=UPI0033EB7951
MGAAEDIADFASLLRELKQRSGLSYEALAKRAHMSTSTLHRYCRGDGVPADYAVLSRFARLCKATPDELVELHRRWVLADAARERGRRGAVDAAADSVPGSEPASVPDEAPDPVRTSADVTVPATPSLPTAPDAVPARPAAGRVPGRRKRWVLVSAGVAVVVVVSTALAVDLEGTGTTADGRPTTPAASASVRSAPHPSASAEPSRKPSSSPPASPSSPSATEPSAGATTRAPAPESVGVPLTVSTRTYGWDDPQCEAKYLIDRPPAQVGPPVMGQDVPGWVAANGAVAADEQRVALTVQGTGDETVVIESMHVGVAGSSTPPAWNAYLGSSGCGGGVETRSFDTDLDAGHPVITPKAGQRGFPYKVSRTDPEVLYITAHADTHDVRWYVDLQWNSGGRQGTIRISDHGRAFRTSGSRRRPVYEFLLGGTKWYRNSGG